MLKSGLLRFSDIYFYIKNWIEIYILLVSYCRQIFMQIIVCENLGGDAKKQRKSTCVCLALTKKKSHPQSRWLPRLLVSFQQAAYFNESGLMEVPNSYRSKLAEEWGFEPQRSVTRL